ncbi:hypothetical protein G3480_23850 [Thiorhodococcus mannitoliphagus]|uniref:Uncharacterized protein n=1 Tax=Thiorhodococcus mannitoliphagus TaxID=329406 RepID=A0A6P1E256_9GAMM|nr:hypothetical protein [Thiorhodococcus mannitoliphagus]NEX23293.1 hypothetical protein [Thiorhodococcus mannitoliphagus]
MSIGSLRGPNQALETDGYPALHLRVTGSATPEVQHQQEPVRDPDLDLISPR